MSTQQTSGGGGAGPVIMAVLVIGLLVLLIFLSSSERPRERSATGFNGLVAWMKHNGVETRSFTGGAPLVRGEIGLRIVPLYDTDLRNEREVPDTREGAIAETSEADMPLNVLRRKINSLPTMVVLPKWRTGMRKLGVAHKDLLIPQQELNRLLDQLGLAGAQIRRDPEGYTETRVGLGQTEHLVGLMHAQSLRNSWCMPLMGPDDAPILVHCATQNATSETSSPIIGGNTTRRPNRGPDDIGFWILADPDVLNNHGLPLAQNGAVALRIAELFD